MNNIRERAITQSDNTRSRLATIKLVHLLFISSLVGLFSLSTSAAEPINTASKTDSSYYDGSYGKGAYWVTPGLYGSMFSVGSKVKRYFIYSHYQRDPASDFIQISHDVARAETELMRNKLGLPRKIQIKILGSYKQKTLSSRKPTTLINNF
ncbi:MAG: hypothetical protein V3T88_05355 [Nitrosomonadaceae bacterium]|jgi:hypothetical protein